LIRFRLPSLKAAQSVNSLCFINLDPFPNIGTTNPLNARRNLEAAEKGPLPAGAVHTLASAYQRAVIFGNLSWPGLT
jgi:hypothetical protein